MSKKRKTPKEVVEEGYDLEIKNTVVLKKGRKKITVSEEKYVLDNKSFKENKSLVLPEVYQTFAESLLTRLEMDEYPDYLKKYNKV